VTRGLIVLCRILFYRPLILVMILLVYGVAVLLCVAVDSPKRGIGVALMAAFAAGGLAALLTERISRYSIQAGMIGLPDHTRVMRRAQGCFLVVFVAAPVVPAFALGANPLAAVAALATATAAGLVFASYGGIWFLLAAFGSRLLPLGEWAQLAPVQALATAISGYFIWRWFDLPRKTERTAALIQVRLADARHERRERHYESADDTLEDGDNSPSNAVPADIASGTRFSAVLAHGFGYSVGLSRRNLLRSIGIAAAALAAWKILHGAKPAALAYLLVTGLCCLGLVARLQVVSQRWMRTSTEQALLQLAPKWPEARAIKCAVIATTLLVQRASIIVWLLSSVAAVLLNSIGSEELLWGLVAVMGTSLAFSGAILAVLARRRIREWHFSTILIVLIVGAGAVTIIFGAATAPRYWMAGIAMMCIPPALALAAYSWAPLRFPLNVDAAAYRSSARPLD
jgi:hypothetical protein